MGSNGHFHPWFHHKMAMVSATEGEKVNIPLQYRTTVLFCNCLYVCAFVYLLPVEPAVGHKDFPVSHLRADTCDDHWNPQFQHYTSVDMLTQVPCRYPHGEFINLSWVPCSKMFIPTHMVWFWPPLWQTSSPVLVGTCSNIDKWVF